MYARTSLVQADPATIDDAQLDAGVAYTRDEVVPVVAAQDGSLGMSLLLDRQGGRLLTISAWRDEAAMAASAPVVAPLRQRAADIFGTGTVEIDGWEIVVRHVATQATPGSCVRMVRLALDPRRADAVVDYYTRHALPAFEALPGFQAATMFLDRAGGRAMTGTTFTDRASMDAAREQAQALRQQAVEGTGMSVVEVMEFEVAVAALRVPERV